MMRDDILIVDGTRTERSDERRPAYRAPAAEKALDILEFMSERREGVTQKEISVGVGRSIHEIYRVIQMLEQRGYITRSPKSDRYRLTLKLFELAHRHPPVNRLIDVALPVMRSLAQSADQSCHIAVLNGTQIMVVLQVDSPLPMRYSVALGSQFPILETSSGAVLLACLPPAEREQLVAKLAAAGPDHDTVGIGKRLGDIEALGYEMRPSLAVEACTNISVPLRDHTGAVIAALTVPYLQQTRARFDRKAVFAMAREAAIDISRALGAPEGAGKPAGDREDRSVQPAGARQQGGPAK